MRAGAVRAGLADGIVLSGSTPASGRAGNRVCYVAVSSYAGFRVC